MPGSSSRNAQLQALSDEIVPAVGPLASVTPGDVGEAADAFDAWLRGISGGRLTLSELETFAGALPIVGNIMAAIDAVGDLIAIVDKKAENEDEDEGFFNWVSLGVNLIGISPEAGSAMRLGLRPMVQLVRTSLRTATHDELRGIEAHHGLDLAVSGPTFRHGALTSRCCIHKQAQGFQAFTEYAIANGPAPLSREALFKRLGRHVDAVLVKGDKLYACETESAAKATADRHPSLAPLPARHTAFEAGHLKARTNALSSGQSVVLTRPGAAALSARRAGSHPA